MENESLVEPGTPSFRLRKELQPAPPPPPTPYQLLCAAYARAVATDPQVGELTRAAIEVKLRADTRLAKRDPRVHQHRSRLLQLFLTKPAWRTSELPQALNLTPTPLYDANRALRDVGLLAFKAGSRHGGTTYLTPAGEAWLLELVEPGSLG